MIVNRFNWTDVKEIDTKNGYEGDVLDSSLGVILVTPAPNGNKAGIFIYINKNSFEGNYPKFFTWFDGDINTAKKLAEKTVLHFYGNENVRKEDIEKYIGFQTSWTPYYDIERGEDFKRLSHILETGESRTIENIELGDITIDKGETGKKGYGLIHIIEDRVIQEKSEDEITAILHLVVQSAKEGKITREIPFKDNPDHKGRVELEKDGIIAILSRQRYQGDDEKWLLTGFDSNEKKEEATEAIQTVIAQYGSSLEFSGFRNQVGAVVSSLQVSHQLNYMSSEIETARKAGYVQGVCECVAAIGNDHALGKKLLTEMNVTKDMAKKYANPETFKTLEQGIFAQKQEQILEQTHNIKR